MSDRQRTRPVPLDDCYDVGDGDSGHRSRAMGDHTEAVTPLVDRLPPKPAGWTHIARAWECPECGHVSIETAGNHKCGRGHAPVAMKVHVFRKRSKTQQRKRQRKRLQAEVRRLRSLLERYGIDPDLPENAAVPANWDEQKPTVMPSLRDDTHHLDGTKRGL